MQLNWSTAWKLGFVKVQSDEDKNHHDCHDVNLHGLNVSFLCCFDQGFFLLVVFIYFCTNSLTQPLICDIIIITIKEVDIHVFIVCVFYNKQMNQSSAFFYFPKKRWQLKTSETGAKKIKKIKNRWKFQEIPSDSGLFLLIYFSFYINILVNPECGGRFSVNFLFFLFLIYLLY